MAFYATSYTEEDSPDFSESEAARAIPTGKQGDVAVLINATTCSSCGARTQPMSYDLRRRSKHLFWRIRLRCLERHDVTLIVQTDWLRGGT